MERFSQMDQPTPGQRNEMLWRFFQDHVHHGRHHETLRATSTTVLLAIDAGILGLLGAAHTWPLRREQLPLTLFLILVGLFGAFFSAKYHERFEFHMNRAREYRTLLEKNLGLGSTQMGDLRDCADNKTKEKYPWLYELRLHKFWVLLHLLIAGLGLLLTFLLIYKR